MKLKKHRTVVTVTQRSLEENSNYSISTYFIVGGMKITQQQAEEVARILVTPISYKYSFEVTLNDQGYES